MDLIVRDKIIQQNSQYTVVLYLNPDTTEFGDEFQNVKEHTPLKQEARNYMRRKYPHLKKFTIQIVLGTMLIGTFASTELTVSAAEKNVYPDSTYTIQKGDTLYSLARNYKTTVNEIKNLNDLNSNVLSIGQEISLPNFFYTAVSGDTLSMIAKNFETTVSNIQSLNGLNTDMIYVGQKLLVPNHLKTEETTTNTNENTTVVTPTEPVRNEVQTTPENTDNQASLAPTEDRLELFTYIVAPGDYLTKIANTYNTTVKELKSLNNLTSDFIYIGQKLVVPQKSAMQEETTPFTNTDDTTTKTEQDSVKITDVEHIVKAGDTLYGISRQYNVSVDKIKAYNKLTTNIISIGQVIKIPGIITNTTTNEKEAVQDTVETEPTYDLLPYTVKSGDTLNKIASNYRTTVDSIKKGNNIVGDTIYINQKLQVPVAPGADFTAPNKPNLESTPYISNENKSNVDLTGTTEPNATVQFIITDGSTKQELKTMADSKGAYDIHFDSTNFKDGPLEIRAIALDQSGNKSSEAVITLLKDTVNPTAPIVQSPDMITSLNVESFEITGSADRDSTVYFVVKDTNGNVVDQQTRTNKEGQYRATFNLASLTGDSYELEVYQVDDVDNKSSVVSKQIVVDRTGPLSLELNQLSDVTGENASQYAISGKTDPNSTVNVIVSGASNSIMGNTTADADGNFSMQLDLTKINDGNLSYSIVTEDDHGNRGKVEDGIITKDTKAPEWLTTTFENSGIIAQLNQDEYRINGTSSENDATVFVEVTDGTTTLTDSALVVNGTFSFPMDVRELKDGQLKVFIYQKDLAGNTSKIQQYYVHKDTVVDSAVIEKSQLSNQAGKYIYTVSGKGEPNSDIQIIASGQTSLNDVTAIAKVDANGNFNISIDLTSLKDERPFITSQQIDSSGNKSKPVVTGITSYIVGSGDSLWKIATQFNTSISDIKALNNLTTDTLMIGQELKLPSIAGVSLSVLPENQVFNMGYLYFGNSQNFTEAVLDTNGTMNVVSPTYFNLNSDGSLQITSQFDRAFIATMQSNGIRVVPFLSNHWDRAVGEAALENRVSLAHELANMIITYNLDGLNVDIENVTQEYRDEYTDFIRILRDLLPEDKEVSVAVAANPYNINVGWQGSYDYAKLAPNSDYLMIMAYDESYPGGPPGPVASIDFVEQSIQYAINKGVPKDKIVLGIGHYGRYWKEGSTYGGYGISNQQVQQAVELYNGTVTFDEKSQSPKAVFTVKEGDPLMFVYGEALTPGTYTVWFENEQSIRAKMDLVEKYGIKGTGNWGVEQENPEFWETFEGWVAPPTEQ